MENAGNRLVEIGRKSRAINWTRVSLGYATWSASWINFRLYERWRKSRVRFIGRWFLLLFSFLEMKIKEEKATWKTYKHFLFIFKRYNVCTHMRMHLIWPSQATPRSKWAGTQGEGEREKNVRWMKTLNRGKISLWPRTIDWERKCRTALKMNSSWSFVWGVAISHFSSVIYVAVAFYICSRASLNLVLSLSTRTHFEHSMCACKRVWLCVCVCAPVCVWQHRNHLVLVCNAIRIVLPLYCIIYSDTIYDLAFVCLGMRWMYDAIPKSGLYLNSKCVRWCCDVLYLCRPKCFIWASFRSCAAQNGFAHTHTRKQHTRREMAKSSKKFRLSSFSLFAKQYASIENDCKFFYDALTLRFTPNRHASSLALCICVCGSCETNRASVSLDLFMGKLFLFHICHNG